MKRVILHSEPQRKPYKTPLLKDLGKVEELTKGIKGSLVDDTDVLNDKTDEEAP